MVASLPVKLAFFISALAAALALRLGSAELASELVRWTIGSAAAASSADPKLC